MKAALIVPESSIVDCNALRKFNLDQNREFMARKRLWSCPSLSLLTIAGMLTNEYMIDYIDLNYTPEFSNEYDIAFLSPTTSEVTRAYEIADRLRLDGTKVVMGGVHVSIMVEEALQHADVVFAGESEETFPDFLTDLKQNRPLTVYKAKQQPDIALCPVPRYDLARHNAYKSIPVQTSRGCPHQCEFCLSSRLYGTKYRKKSISQIKKELMCIKEIWSRPYIFFTDDNMFIDRESTVELLDLLKELQIRWYAFSDVRIADDPDLLELIYDAGCSQLLIGFESLNEFNLAGVDLAKWKHSKLGSYKRVVETIQSFGIGVVGSFVLGFDNDTSETFENLYKFIIDTRLFATNITVLTPFPGTRLHQRFLEEGRILTEDWARYNGFELTFDHKSITRQELEKELAKLYALLNSQERITGVINEFKGIINNRLKDSAY